MSGLSHLLEGVGLVLAVLDFSGLSRKLETILDRAREGFLRLLQKPEAAKVIVFTGGIALALALWTVYGMLWLINKPAAGTVGSLGLILAVAGFVTGFMG